MVATLWRASSCGPSILPLRSMYDHGECRMICPPDYIIPDVVIDRFAGRLSNDEVFAAIAKELQIRVETIPKGQKRDVTNAIAFLLADTFIRNKRADLLLYDLRVGLIRGSSWLLDDVSDESLTLPLNSQSASACISQVKERRLYIDGSTWTIKRHYAFQPSSHPDASSRIPFAMRVTGWSICFPEVSLANDLGGMMRTLAMQFTREKRGAERRGPGRHSKVEPLAKLIFEHLGAECVNMAAKEITRRLQPIATFELKTTTVNNAKAMAVRWVEDEKSF